MQTVAAAYSLELAKRSQATAYLIRVFHVPKAGRVAAYAFSKDFTTGAVTGTGRPYLACLRTPAGNTQTVEPEQGRSSRGVLTYALVDLLGEISRYMANPPATLRIALAADQLAGTVEVNEDISGYPAIGTIALGAAPERVRYAGINASLKQFTGINRAVDGTTLAAHAVGATVQNGEQIRAGQRVSLFAGYQGIGFADWAPVATMEVTATGSDSAAGYTIQTQDMQRFMRQFMLLTATQEVPLKFGGNPLDVLLAWLCSSGTGVISTGTVQGTAPNTVTGSGGTVFLSFLLPGDYVGIGSETTDFQVVQVASVTSDTVFTTVGTIASTAAGLSYVRAGENGKYDVLSGTNGLAVPAAFADITGIEALKASDFAGQKYSYSLTAPVEGKSFIERELKTMNVYPVILRTGAWSLRRYRPATQGVTPAVAALTEDDLLSWQWAGGESQILNVCEFQYDWNISSAAADDYSTRQRYKALDSINKYGARPAFKITALGIRTALGGQAILDDRAFQLFKRYADPPAVLQVAVRYSRHVLEAGDLISVTHRLIPNRRTGLRGMTAQLFEIRDIRPAFGATAGQSGLVMTLLDIGNQTIPAAPVSDGAENNLQTLIVNRASFFNDADVAVSAVGTEVQTASVTVTLVRTTDSLIVNARQSIDATLANIADYTTSRIRKTSIAGTLLDGVSPPTFATSVGKSSSVTSLGVVAHDFLYEPNTTGPITIIMSIIPSASGAGGVVRSRSLTVTVRSR